MTVTLLPHQEAVLPKLESGKILVGGTGAGKSITALAFAQMKYPGKKIVVLTTAKKRDDGEWFTDAMKMSLDCEMVVDSWNMIGKYVDIEAFFILDEQRIVGSGAWVKAFYKIAERNPFILLSATPADSWMDLIPIFVANGFYKNKTEFCDLHVSYSRYTRYPKVDKYHNPEHLELLRSMVLVEMPYLSKNARVEQIINVDYDREEESLIYRRRWNPELEKPIKNAGEMLRLLRRSTNRHDSRKQAIIEIAKTTPRLIVYYNHDYEREILLSLMTELDIPMAEWNGHAHQDIPTTDRWIYLVQYQAGSEGWNCVTTDSMIFYSLPYSYRWLEQARGRIDRLNTKHDVVYYYILKSDSIMDRSIWRALRRKKNFQASAFAKKWERAA